MMQKNELFEKLFEIRQQAHVLHLKSQSYAEHIALGEFYEKLTELTDELIEVYQGQYDLVKINPISNSVRISPKEMLVDFATLLNSDEEKDSHLANIIDEIKALTYRTLYKIKFLA